MRYYSFFQSADCREGGRFGGGLSHTRGGVDEALVLTLTREPLNLMTHCIALRYCFHEVILTL